MADIYEIKLPQHIERALLGLVGMAERNQVLTLQFTVTMQEGPLISAKQEREIIPSQDEDFLLALKALGFLDLLENKDVMGRARDGTIYLTEKAYEWAHYRRKGSFGRWWDRMVQGGRQAAPLIVSIAAVVLTVLQIIQTVVTLLIP